jgi:hypothetical protein
MPLGGWELAVIGFFVVIPVLVVGGVLAWVLRSRGRR